MLLHYSCAAGLWVSREGSRRMCLVTARSPRVAAAVRPRGLNNTSVTGGGHPHPKRGLLLLLFSCSVVSDSLWLHGRQHTRPPCPSPSPRVCSDSCLLCWWCYLTISSYVTPSPPPLYLYQHQGLFQWAGSSHQVAKELELQLQHQSL